MCDGDIYLPQMLRDDFVRAAKEHWCCACGEVIRKGERYHYRQEVYEGSIDTAKHCVRCYAICEALWDRSDGGSIDLQV